MKRLFPVLLILAFNLLLMQCGFNVAGGSEVWGKVAVVNGGGVPGVSVKLYQSNGENLNDSAVEITETDKNGVYRFKEPGAGSYVISGHDTRSGDVFLRRNIEYESGRVEYYDTLKAAGTLLIVFKGADVTLDGIPGFVPGTPYFRFIENDSLRIPGMASGRYVCKAALQTLDFMPVVTDSFDIEPGMQTVIEVNLEKSPDANLPKPQNFILEKIVDTLAGRAILKWDPVNVSDLKGYILYRGLDRDSITTSVASTTFTFDTICLVVDTTGILVDNYFQVKAIDTLNNLSSGSDILTIPAPSPQIVKTTIVFDTLIAPHDKLYIGDTVAIVVVVNNAGRLVDSIRWAVERSDSVVSNKAVGGVHQYIDTMKFVWDDGLAKMWYITAIDNSGASVTTAEKVTGSGMYAPDTWRIFPAKLPKVRSYLSVVSDGLKIYTFGGVEEKYNLSLQKIVKATSNVIESFTPDSFLSFQTSKMYSPRCYHSSISYNGMIFSFGGMATDRKDVSTIEVFDPVTGQSRIIDSLPYIRYGASLSFVNNKIVMAGGVVVRGLDTAVTGAIDIYDIAKAGSGNDALSHYGELLKPRTNHSAVVHDGRLFVIGGVDTSTFNTLSDVEMFDLHTGTQTVVPAMNQNRAHFSAVIVEDRIFAFGGVSNLETYLSSVEVMDLGNNDGWKFVNQMNHPKYGMATVVHNGKVYMLGGNVIGANGKIELDSTVNVYYP